MGEERDGLSYDGGERRVWIVKYQNRAFDNPRDNVDATAISTGPNR